MAVSAMRLGGTYYVVVAGGIKAQAIPNLEGHHKDRPWETNLETTTLPERRLDVEAILLYP
jgi:hypothetical protein